MPAKLFIDIPPALQVILAAVSSLRQTQKTEMPALTLPSRALRRDPATASEPPSQNQAFSGVIDRQDTGPFARRRLNVPNTFAGL